MVNPSKEGAADAVTALEEACAGRNWPKPIVVETTVEETGASQAREAVDAGTDVVIAGGGDGTVRSVALGLMESNVALGLVPMGTGNLFARHLGIPLNSAEEAIELALTGSEHAVDMGLATLYTPEGETRQEQFLVMGGIGLDAEVIAGTRDRLKQRVGWLAYSEAGFRLMPGPRQRMHISLNGSPTQSRRVRSILFANLGTLPGGIDFIQGARIDDGVLDIVVMSPRSLIGWAGIFAKTLLRHQGAIGVLDFYKATQASVSVTEPTETQMDGDVTGRAMRVDVKVKPHSLVVRSN